MNISFYDIIKANVKYLFVTLLIMAISIGIAVAVGNNENTGNYRSKITFLVDLDRSAIVGDDKNTNYLTTAYASIEINNSINYFSHKDFGAKVLKKIQTTSPNIASTLTAERIASMMKFSTFKDANAFTLYVENSDANVSKMIVDMASELIPNEYKEEVNKNSLAVMHKIYTSETIQIIQKSTVVSQVKKGLVIGFVLGVFLISIFAVVNPFVDSSKRIEETVGAKVLGVVSKKKSKNEPNNELGGQMNG